MAKCIITPSSAPASFRRVYSQINKAIPFDEFHYLAPRTYVRDPYYEVDLSKFIPNCNTIVRFRDMDEISLYFWHDVREQTFVPRSLREKKPPQATIKINNTGQGLRKKHLEDLEQAILNSPAYNFTQNYYKPERRFHNGGWITYSEAKKLNEEYPIEEKEMDKKLYTVTDGDHKGKYVTRVATDADGKIVVKSEQTGEYFAVAGASLARVIPYSVDVKFYSNGSLSGQLYSFWVEKGAVEVGDVIFGDHSNAARVMEIDTKSETATKWLVGSVVRPAKVLVAQ